MRHSLTSELSCFFDIIECNYETYDPRYVISVGKRKKNPESAASILEKLGTEETQVKNYSLGMTSKELLENIEAFCDFLESHENNVLQFIKNDELKSDRNPIQGVKTEFSSARSASSTRSLKGRRIRHWFCPAKRLAITQRPITSCISVPAGLLKNRILGLKKGEDRRLKMPVLESQW